MQILLVAIFSAIKSQQDVLVYDSVTCLQCTNEGTDKNSKCFEMNEVDFVNATTCKSLYGCTKK